MITHSLSATTPDDPAYEIRPSHWNQAHIEAKTLSGNTLGASTVSGTNVIFQAGNNFTLSANNDTLVFIGPNPAGGAYSAGVSTGGNTVGSTGITGTQLVFAGGNNITLSQSTGANGGTITISGPNTAAQTNQTLGLYASSNTTGQSSSSTADARSLTFRGAGVASVGMSAGEVVISVPAGGANFSAGVSTGGNTAGDTGVTGTRLVFAGGNNITVSQGTDANGATITFSGANAGGAQTGISGIVVSDTTYTSGTVSFSNAGNITISSSVNGATQFIRLSGNAAQTNVAFSADASSTFQTLSFQDSNGLSFSNNAGAIRVSYTRNVASNAIQSVGSATGSGTNTSRFAADDHVHAGVFSMGVSNDAGNISGDTRVDVGRFVLRGGNNITLSQITAANALNTIVVSAGATGGVNPVASASNGSFSFTTLGFSNANNVTFGTSAGSIITASVAAPGAAAENNWFTLAGDDAGNVVGNSSASGSTIQLSARNLTLSGTNGSQIMISAPATSSIVGVSGISISSNGSTISVQPVTNSYYENPYWMVNSTSFTVAASTSIVWPIELRGVERFDFIRMPQTVSQASMASIATAANNTKTYNQQGTFNFVLYSRGIGASSQSLQSVASTSASSRMSIAVGQNANGSQWTVTHAYSFPATNGTTSSSTSYATTLTNVNVSTTHLTRISGMKHAAFPWSTTISAQQYWLAYGFSTTQTTDGNASLSNMRVTFSNWGMSQPNNTWGEFGSANNASIQARYGIGSFTTVGGGTTASMDFSNVSSSSAHVVPYIMLARIA